MKNISLYAILILLLAGCARQGALTGGAKDTTPPEVTKASPANYSTNFNASRIEIVFDEYVRLKNMDDNVVLSPPMQTDPDIFLKGKTLVIKLNSPVQPNKTYALDFGEAIEDNNEGNKLTGFRYVFATGPEIDSFSIPVHVQDAARPEEIQGVKVLAYRTDKKVLLDFPDYVGMTDKDGKCTLQNMAKGTYRLAALKDIDDDWLYNLPGEIIAFGTTDVQTEDSIGIQELQLFEEENTNQFVVDKKTLEVGKLEYITNRPANNPQLQLSGYNILMEQNPKGDSTIFWYRGEWNKEVEAVFSADNLQDTSLLDLPKRRDAEPQKLLSRHRAQRKEVAAKLQFLYPVETVNFDGVVLQVDSNTYPITAKEFSGSNRIWEFQWDWEYEKRYSLVFPAGALTDYWGNANDSITCLIRTQEENYFGQVQLTLPEDYGQEQRILQLLDGQQKLLREVAVAADQKDVALENLMPGKYNLRLIVDLNKNGKWDTGLLETARQPEPILARPDNMNVASGFDSQLNW